MWTWVLKVEYLGNQFLGNFLEGPTPWFSELYYNQPKISKKAKEKRKNWGLGHIHWRNPWWKTAFLCSVSIKKMTWIGLSNDFFKLFIFEFLSAILEKISIFKVTSPTKDDTQPAIACPKLTIETLEQVVKYIQS